MFTLQKKKQNIDDHNVFGDDTSDEEEEVEQQQQKQQSKFSSKTHQQQQHVPNRTNDPNSMSNLIAQRTTEQALQQDSTIFQYDDLYDEMHSHNNQNASSTTREEEESTAVPKSKYISQLMKNAENRKKERDRVFDRKMTRQLEQELEAVGGASQVFVTSAYKKKLEEQKKMDERDVQQREQEKKQDVNKRGGMSGFYHIARDIAFGGSQSGGVGVGDDDVEDVIKKKEEKEEDERNAKDTVVTRRQQQESSSVRRTHDEPKERIPEVSRRKLHQDKEEIIVDKQQSELDLAAQKAEKIRAARQRYLERRALSTKK